MAKKSPEEYEVEDFLTDSSFINYHRRLNTVDQSFWEKWITNHPEKKDVIKRSREILENLSLTISEKEFSWQLEKMKASIDERNTTTVFKVSNPYTKYSYLWRRKILLISSVLLVFVLSAYFLIPALHDKSKQLIETVNKSNVPLSLVLSDSTVVTLAAFSSLQYPSSFQGNNRNVYLQGEARFFVKRNELAPFKVYSKNVVATVLGTVFNFKKVGDSFTIVELLNGKLNVEILNDKNEPTASLLLTPNQRAVYVFHDQHLFSEVMMPETNVTFHQNNFAEIASKFKNAFGITLINKSNNMAWKVTAEFKNASAREIIENICLVKKLSAEIKGDTIYIKN